MYKRECLIIFLYNKYWTAYLLSDDIFKKSAQYELFYIYIYKEKVIDKNKLKTIAHCMFTECV